MRKLVVVVVVVDFARKHTDAQIPTLICELYARIHDRRALSRRQEKERDARIPLRLTQASILLLVSLS